MSSPLFLSPRWLIVKTPAWKLYSLFPEEKALVAGGCCVLRASEWRALKLREEAEGWVGKEKALGMEPPFSELRELAMGDAHKTHETCVPGSRCWKQVLQCSQTVGCTLLCGLVWKSKISGHFESWWLLPFFCERVSGFLWPGYALKNHQLG